jgi:sulfite reductase beta subunit-like hemoprotein
MGGNSPPTQRIDAWSMGGPGPPSPRPRKCPKPGQDLCNTAPMEPTAVEQTSAVESEQASAAESVAERVTAEHKLKVSHKDQAGKGRVGSLENPEVYEDVPGHVIPIIEREFDDFDTEAARFMRGEVPEDKFIGFRLKQGVYGQRQADVQMIRVKLPLGGVNPEQMEAFADAIEKYAPLRKGHITTRENIQIHHVPLPDAAKFIREISDAGLSSREGCGNTIRNVTGDPWAGISEGELFDITPYAMAYVRYFVRHPVTQLMPRKVKTAFTATDEDVAITGIHDIGFIPRLRDGVRGVEIRVGGGTSIMPRIAPTLYEFVELDNGDYLKVAEACWRIFDRQEWLRENRARARIKVLIDKIGIDAFREMVEEELQGDWVDERDFDVERLKFVDDEEAKAPPPAGTYGSPNGDRSEFDHFLDANVKPQRQEGFSAIEVKVTRGDLTPEQLRGLAAITREFSGGYARTTVQQNLVLRWVRDESAYDVWERLGELGLDGTGPREITDVVSCPGTDSCKLGITSSMGLNQVVQERLEAMEITDPLTKRIHIKMSGCPNGCAQHHIANIGFYGASHKVGERTIPAYIAHLAGNYEGGEVIYGHRLKARLPAKRVPDAVERWVRFYEQERHDGEEFNDFVERIGTDQFEAQVKDLAMPVEFSLETLDHFIDWNRSEAYKVERGEGECAV